MTEETRVLQHRTKTIATSSPIPLAGDPLEVIVVDISRNAYDRGGPAPAYTGTSPRKYAAAFKSRLFSATPGAEENYEIGGDSETTGIGGWVKPLTEGVYFASAWLVHDTLGSADWGGGPVIRVNPTEDPRSSAYFRGTVTGTAPSNWILYGTGFTVGVNDDGGIGLTRANMSGFIYHTGPAAADSAYSLAFGAAYDAAPWGYGRLTLMRLGDFSDHENLA